MRSFKFIEARTYELKSKNLLLSTCLDKGVDYV